MKRLKADSGNIGIVTPAKPVPYSDTGAGVYRCVVVIASPPQAGVAISMVGK